MELENLSKRYPGGSVGLAGLDLEIADGEFVVLVGPSGCGKTTALRLVAGLETPSAGRVLLGGRDVTSLPPGERDVAMVFQSYALYPHKTVAENLAFPLRVRRRPGVEVRARVEAVARILGLTSLLERRPAELSGGERQRVALGRAIVREPVAFLLDEPLSNLDARLRAEMRAELARLHRRLQSTMLLVTHDQEEAMTLGDRIVVMREGRVEQVGPPRELYDRPASLFVAGFIGAPAMNELTCHRVREGGADFLVGEGFRLSEPPATPASDLVLAIRPEHLDCVGPDAGDLQGRVEVVEDFGRGLLVHVGVGDGVRLRSWAGESVAVRVGDAVGLRIRRDRLHFFDGANGSRL